METPQLTTKLHIDLGLADARRSVKRTISDSQEANRNLARLEEAVELMRKQLASLGIELEVE